MKNYFKFLCKHAIAFLMLLIVCFLSSVVVVDLINTNKSYYEATFIVENIETFDSELLNDVEYLNSIKNSASKYENIDVEKMLDRNHFNYTINNNEITIQTKAKYYDDFFNSSSLSVGTRAKTFIKDSVLKISDKVTFVNSKDIVELKNHLNKWKISVIAASIFFVNEIIISVMFFFIKKNKEEKALIYDNQTVFKHPFYKEFWKKSVKPLTKVKDITTIAMLFALMLVCKSIPIPSGFGNLGLGITYLFFATIAMIYGPVYGFVIGVFSDIIGFFIDSGGGIFHLGYTLQAALTGFIYGLCFYKTKVTFTKVFVCRLIINLLINVVYGSFLYIVVFYPEQIKEPGRLKELYTSYMTLLSLPKNIIWLLPQSLLLYYVLVAIRNPLTKFKLLDKAVFDK